MYFLFNFKFCERSIRKGLDDERQSAPRYIAYPVTIATDTTTITTMTMEMDVNIQPWMELTTASAAYTLYAADISVGAPADDNKDIIYAHPRRSRN